MHTIETSSQANSRIAANGKVVIPSRVDAFSLGEVALLLACTVLVVLAFAMPPVGLASDYHAFADTRNWLGVPYAGDVLSNLAFAALGFAGVRVNRRGSAIGLRPGDQCLAQLFHWGLILTALCSGIYHWQPIDAGLALDRAGMLVAFAGLLGLAVATRVSTRAGHVLALAVLVLGACGVYLAYAFDNHLPWILLQGGGLLLILALAWVRPVSGALEVRWVAVVAIYGLAKVLELADDQVFALTHGIVSGHNLKHLVAALAALPVLLAIRRHVPRLECPADQSIVAGER